MKVKQLLLWMPWGIALFYFLLSMSLPFWGDSIASVSKAAVRIYEEGLHRPWNYPDADPGHPTLFPWIIALCWALFGKSLWVAHALIALGVGALLGLMRQYVLLYDEKWQLGAFVLFLVSPLLVSQAMEISLALPLTLAFFASVSFLKKGNTVLWILSMIALSLLHLQGMLLVAALGLYDIFRSWPLKQAWWKRFPLYLIPLCSFGLWAWFHQQEFGWAIITPNYGREIPGIQTIIYNLGISTWRLLDLGYFLLFIPVFISFLRSILKGKLSDLDRLFMAVFIVLCVGIPVIFAYPPNHRYIFPVYLLLVPLFIRWLQNKPRMKQSLWFSTAFLFLLSGNLWFYPGKCLGDQNLVFLSYRDIEKEIMEVIPGETVHSFAPLNNPSKFTHLVESRNIRYEDLYERDFDEINFILESNLNCEFTPEMKKKLEEEFVPRVFESYGVYVNVWMNRRLIGGPPNFATRAHVPGVVEEFIQSLKEKAGR